jgi:Cys-tRNA(Pro)/Cys-tRNA(Cys) deacylase
MAKAVSEKKLKMATHAEAEELTGLEVGGISPLALLNRGFDLVVDRSVQAYEQVFMSAGQKGINMKVPVREFMELTGAKCLDIAEYPDVEEG